MESKSIVIAKAKTQENTWFIFRESGQEIEVKIVEGKLQSPWNLTKEETQFIKEKLLKNG